MDDTPLPPHILLACRNSFRYFCKYIMDQKIGAFHEEIITHLETSPKNLLVEAARGHFKTYIISRSYPLWLMWRQSSKKLVIGLQTSNMTQTKFILDLCVNAIENNKYLRDVLYPKDIYHATWSAIRFKTENGHEMIAQPFGRKGYHYDVLISDDLQQESDSGGTSVSIEAIKRSFWSASAPMTNARSGKHLVIGTPISLDDLYHDFDDKPLWDHLHYPAVIVDENGLWQRAQFPEHYSLEKLTDMKNNMPPWAWQTEYMLDPIGAGTSLFPSDTIKKCLQFKLIERNPEGSSFYYGWDVALSDKASADFFAFIVLRKMPDGTLYMVHKLWDKLKEEDQMEKVRALHSQYGFSKGVIEQKGLSFSMAEKVSKDYTLGHSVEKFVTNHTNKEKLIGDLRLVMDNGLLNLMGDQDIARELASFGKVKKADGSETFRALSGHDDLVMALAMAVYAAGGWLPKKHMDGMLYCD